MDTPNLTVSIDEGPKKGETFDRSRPASFIRIGRVVRGNTLAIKDPLISHKHLIIDFHTEISQWAVTDLGTSNGTTVNDAFISPNTPFPLTDGDIIKIGENTSISVKICAPISAPEPRTRRARREKATNVDGDVKRLPEDGKRGRLTRASVKALCADSSAGVLIRKEEEGEASEKRKELVNDGRGGRVRGKRGGGLSSRVSRKDGVVEPVVVEGRRLRSTRSSACVSKVIEGEDEIKEKKVEELVNDRGKQKGEGKRGGRSRRISRNAEAVESAAIGEKVEESLCRALDVVMASSGKVPKDIQKKKMMATRDLNSVYLKGQEKKKLLVKNNASGDGKKPTLSREVRFRIEEAENDKDIMMSGESDKTEDLHFSGKEVLAYSWSSFSEIRGIPNTTSKYREDKMISCHATPFEARVERALNRGIAETSSSTET